MKRERRRQLIDKLAKKARGRQKEAVDVIKCK
jgi:hypothetical protein